MTELDNKILQKASGENRLDPDQQRYYLGTYKERVVLHLSLKEAQEEKFQLAITSALNNLILEYPNLSLKLSPNLPTDVQMFYMKLANRLSLAATIVNEANANSPFGIIIHSDKAENVEWNDFETQFPDLFNSPKKEESPKKSLWQHFFSQK